MIDPNIIAAIIGIMFALLTMDVMMNLYKKMYHYTSRKTYSILKIKKNKDKLREIIFNE